MNHVDKVWGLILTKFQIYPTCNYGVRPLGHNPSTRLMPLGQKVNVHGKRPNPKEILGVNCERFKK